MLAQGGDFQNAKLGFAKLLTSNDLSKLHAAVHQHAGKASWPKPMIGMFAATYQAKLKIGQVKLEWPTLAARETASASFTREVRGGWFETMSTAGHDTAASHKSRLELLPDVPVSGARGQLYGFTTRPLDHDWTAIRTRDYPMVIGAAAGVLNAWRDKIAAGWDASFFEAMDDVTLPVGTIPYGDYIQGDQLQGDKRKDAHHTGDATAVQNKLFTMKDYVDHVVKSPWVPDHAKAYTFSTTSGALYDKLGLGRSFDDSLLPPEMAGFVFCGHDNLDPHSNCTLGVDGDSDAGAIAARTTEAAAVAARLARYKRLEYCNRGCAWQFYLGGVGSGSHPHAHHSAFNILVRGKKRWFVFPPQYTLDTITGGTLEAAFEWAAHTLPTLKQAGVVPSEFVQLPGEVVYVPEGIVHHCRLICTNRALVAPCLGFNNPSVTCYIAYLSLLVHCIQ